jgi:hypothetical protein
VNCSRTTTPNEGASFACLCRGTGGKPQPANVTWYDKDGVQIGETGKEEKSLTLSKVGKTDTGTYTCVAQSHEVSKNETSIELIVNCK